MFHTFKNYYCKENVNLKFNNTINNVQVFTTESYFFLCAIVLKIINQKLTIYCHFLEVLGTDSIRSLVLLSIDFSLPCDI